MAAMPVCLIGIGGENGIVHVLGATAELGVVPRRARGHARARRGIGARPHGNGLTSAKPGTAVLGTRQAHGGAARARACSVGTRCIVSSVLSTAARPVQSSVSDCRSI